MEITTNAHYNNNTSINQLVLVQNPNPNTSNPKLINKTRINQIKNSEKSKKCPHKNQIKVQHPVKPDF